ncbi:hypothetical protein Q8A67_021892 [Cirrhinus molitorella]|uniref:Uncharacterized protein n=1 Tax=Cirrhinus molitorella TaxID=172907 RepID=A0AA88P4E0_9TELE|nr:hypothetical protein Q8A67_021892 [Cirrhinus molitorella]
MIPLSAHLQTSAGSRSVEVEASVVLGRSPTVPSSIKSSLRRTQSSTAITAHLRRATRLSTAATHPINPGKQTDNDNNVSRRAAGEQNAIVGAAGASLAFERVYAGGVLSSQTEEIELLNLENHRDLSRTEVCCTDVRLLYVLVFTVDVRIYQAEGSSSTDASLEILTLDLLSAGFLRSSPSHTLA